METKPIKIVVYHCRNLKLFKDGAQKNFARSRPGVSLVAIPCSGKIEAHHLLKTMAGGAQGVLVLACAEKACQYLEGSMRSHKRADYARSWLDRLGIESGRIEFVHLPPMDQAALDKILKDFSIRLESFDQIPPVAKTKSG
ncbi:MAG: hydrogenase iron-sulfur subunit [Desulfomonile tiedjei]|nr:hydrogenase iron-sulfur subunit [Desulfomonile tiedjei]